MSLDPKDNLNPAAEEAAEVETEAQEATEAEVNKTEPEVQSTIFTKHVYETKKPAKSGWTRRIVVCVVALVLCLAIIGSVILADKLLPGASSSSANNSGLEEETYTVLSFEDIVKDSKVKIDGVEAEVDTNIDSVYFVNGYDQFTVKNYFVKAEKKETTSSSASSSTTSSNAKTYDYETRWYVDGIDKELTLSDSIADTIEDCLNVKGFREMKNNFNSVEEYHEHFGMSDKLTAGVVVTFNDGTEKLVISVGDALATGDSYYFMTSLSDTIYAVKTDYTEAYFTSTKSFADSTVIEKIVKTDKNSKYYNSTGQLARFDKIRLSGEVFGGKTYEFGLATGVSADYMPYKMTAPYKRPANDAFISNILKIASDGLEATVLYSYNTTDKDNKECGFDKPKCVIELTIDDYSFKLTIGGNREDGTDSMTAKVEGKPQAYGIDPDDIAFLIAASNDITKMFNQNFILEDIYTIKSFKMEVPDGSYKFDLKHVLREGEDDVYDTEVKLGNTVMKTQSFKLIYQRVLMLSLLEYVTEAEKGKTVLKCTFNYIEGGEPKVVEFTESPSDRYHYVAWVDGTPLGEVLKTSLDDITTNLEVYLNGGDVPDTW